MPAPIGPPQGDSRQGVLTLILLAASGIVLWWLSGEIARERYLAVIIVAGFMLVTWVVLRWRTSVYVFSVYVVMEGFLVNYFYTTPALNLLKDVFVAALFSVLAASLVPRGIMPLPRTAWIVPFLLYAVLYTAEIFNPNLPTIMVGLIGLRVSLLYATLVPVSFWFFDTQQRVLHFMAFQVLLSVPVSLFGIFQYFAGPSWLVSLSPGFARAVFYTVGAGGSVQYSYFRTLSTFVHTGAFSTYLWFMMLITLACMFMPSLRAHRVKLYVILAIQFLGMLTTGGRAPLVLFLFSLGLLLLMRGRLFRLAPILGILGATFMLAIVLLGPGIVERFVTVLDPQESEHRNMPLAIGWLQESMKADAAGLGAGYASVASRHAGVTELNQGVIENTLARVRFEAGIVGLVLYAAFLAALCLECVRASRATRSMEIGWLISAIAAFMLVDVTVNVPIGTPFDTSPTNVYLWFYLGALARAPYFAAQAAREEILAAQEDAVLEPLPSEHASTS